MAPEAAAESGPLAAADPDPDANAAAPRRPRRIGVIECEDAEKWRDMTLALWRRTLGRPGDEFVVYRGHLGDVPTVEEAAALDAVVIGGSHFSVYEGHEWISALKAAARSYLDARATRLVGCCFGCQLLAEALGGRVGKNPSGRFVLGVEAVAPSDEGLEAVPGLRKVVEAALDQQRREDEGEGKEGAEGADTGAGAGGAPCGVGSPEGPVRPCFRVMESHGDQVLELPPGAVGLASSGTARHEMWAHPSGALAFQFHSE